MSTLITNLRAMACEPLIDDHSLCAEAADKIEKLAVYFESYLSAHDDHSLCAEAADEIEKLERELNAANARISSLQDELSRTKAKLRLYCDEL
jgi:septal ring factor EnvC (AmiA/AmiB activator)